MKKLTQEFTAKLQHPNPYIRAKAAKSIGSIGKKCPEIISILIHLFHDSWKEVRYYALKSLAKVAIKEEMEPIVCRALGDESRYIRYYAIRLVDSFKMTSAPIVPLLLSLANDSDENIRFRSLEVISDLAETIESKQNVISVLQSILHNDANIKTRCLVFNILGVLEQKNRDNSLIELLIKNLSSLDINTRIEASFYLSELGFDAKPAVSSLIKALQDPSDDVHIHCQRSLTKIFYQPKYAIPILKKLLKNKDADVKKWACNYLYLIGKEAFETIPLLVEILFDEDEIVRDSALSAIATIGITEEHLEMFLRLYENSTFSKYTLILIIGTVENSSILPIMVSLLKSDALYIRSCIVEILAKKKFYPKNINILIKQLSKENNLDFCKKIIEHLKYLPLNTNDIQKIIEYPKKNNDRGIDFCILLMLTHFENFQTDIITKLKRCNDPDIKRCVDLIVKNNKKEVITDQLFSMLNTDSCYFYTWVIEFLPQVHHEREKFIPMLLHSLENGSDSIAKTITKIDIPLKYIPQFIDKYQNSIVKVFQRPKVFSYIKNLLENSSVQRTCKIIEIMGDIPNLPQSEIPVLIQFLQHDDEEICFYSIIAIGNLKAKEAIPWLLPHLKSSHEDILRVTMEAIEKIGVGGSHVIYSVSEIFRKANWHLRFDAAQVLGSIADPLSINCLKEQLTDPDEEVREKIIWALEQIAERNETK